jgi:hypothetical protein
VDYFVHISASDNFHDIGHDDLFVGMTYLHLVASYLDDTTRRGRAEG